MPAALTTEGSAQRIRHNGMVWGQACPEPGDMPGSEPDPGAWPAADLPLEKLKGELCYEVWRAGRNEGKSRRSPVPGPVTLLGVGQARGDQGSEGANGPP